MVNAFQAGMRALFGDPNIATDAVYTPVSGTGAVTVRAISSDPLVAVGGPGLLSASASRPTVHLLQAEVPIKPAKGDLLVVGAHHWKVAEVTADNKDLRWLLVLVNA